MKSSGYFLISLDFELQWGRFDKVGLNEQRQNELDNTIEIIPKILKLFYDNDIAATWAVVGMLFNKNENEWKGNLPQSIPVYSNANLSPYIYFKKIKKNGVLDKYFFAQESINIITSVPKQELASHTYSHYYCLEKGQKIDNFKDDITKARQLIEQLNSKMDSLVLPRNQFNKKYKSICKELELTAIRTNPSKWYWQADNDNIYKKIFRLIDTFNLFSYNKCIQLSYFESQKSKPYLMPSSRFFRSWSPKIKILNSLKLKRILLEMSFAAKHNKYYHIWWHPENFGQHPTQCMNELEIIVSHYKKLNKKYGFKSLTMKGFGDLITTQKNNVHNY